MKFEIGDVFGKLVITGKPEIYRTSGGWTYHIIECKCDCGNITKVRKSLLKSGTTYSCGCVATMSDGSVHERHNMRDSNIYTRWYAMRQRCTDPNSIGYPNYGGRGITIDEKWRSFAGFYKDMGDTFEEHLSLDRIDPNGNYCKDNCRWTDKRVQAYNQRKPANNKSGKTGVAWDKKSSKWRVKFTMPDRSVHVAWYKYLWDAVYERMLLEQTYHGRVKE